jgi:hypothetical protein
MAWIHLYRVVSGGWGNESPLKGQEQAESPVGIKAIRSP